MVKAREPNAISGLAGRVSGLTITPSTNLFGDPGITLRGRSNILIVVDGMPINTDSWNLSPDDIESYSVLKGANAAALYGNRGQNGAIVITTKRAKSQDKGFQVEFNSSTQLQTGYNAIPKIQTEYGPGSNYQYAFKDGRGGGINDNDYNIWGPRFEGQLIPQYNSPIDPKTGQLIPLPWEARGKDHSEEISSEWSFKYKQYCYIDQK
ncbi:TonB-dependent receptor plug domain-containing protein [Sphingobacterium multivorum]